MHKFREKGLNIRQVEHEMKKKKNRYSDYYSYCEIRIKRKLAHIIIVGCGLRSVEHIYKILSFVLYSLCVHGVSKLAAAATEAEAPPANAK